MTKTELQNQFKAETGTNHINSQGESDIDYVAWLEGKVLEYGNKCLCELETHIDNLKENGVDCSQCPWTAIETN